MLTVVLLALLALGGAAVVWVWRQRTQEEEEYHIHSCRKCQQKVRYPASRAGRLELCPRCGLPLALPTQGPKVSAAYSAQRSFRVARTTPGARLRRSA
jgi:uncharacterized paraquat-inducible protein A